MLLSTAVLLIFYSAFYFISRIDTIKKSDGKIIPISLIICAKNEIHNLKVHLPQWMSQNHPDFELILVNDGSDDGSGEWLETQKVKYPQLKIVEIPADEEKILKGKRHALLRGLEAATKDYIVLTDADCYPVSQNWLKQMTTGFSFKKNLVIGYSPYECVPGFLNKLIQYDTLMTALQYLGLASIGLPYMGVGRNLAYKKSLVNADIINASNKSLSGDDDLVVNELVRYHRAHIELHPDSWVVSKPLKTFRQWVTQKTRHSASGYHYRPVHKILLGLFVLANWFWYAGLAGLIILGLYNIAIVLFVLKSVLFYSLCVKLKRKIQINDMEKHFFYVDVLYWVFVLFFQIKHIFTAGNVWSVKENRR
jgi:cellulose synthase/poly-beta-1,6-N-acetylglucosamine synthase-like glycosyltransferase